MSEVWQMSAEDFVGDWPVVPCDEEFERAARASIEEWEGRWVRSGLRPLPGHPGFFTWDIPSGLGTLLLLRDRWGDIDLVGGYVEETLWLDPGVRGRGISPLLVLARAEALGGRPNPVTYTPAGKAAHAAAHRLAVRMSGRGS